MKIDTSTVFDETAQTKLGHLLSEAITHAVENRRGAQVALVISVKLNEETKKVEIRAQQKAKWPTGGTTASEYKGSKELVARMSIDEQGQLNLELGAA